jgi:hypothetical protein
VGCGCLRIEAIPAKIRAGETEEIRLRFDPRTRRGLTEVVAHIESSHSDFANCRVIVRAIVGGIWSHPQFVHVGTVRRNEADDDAAACFIVAAGYPEAQVVSVESESEQLRCHLEPAVTAPETLDQRLTALCRIRIDWIGDGAIETGRLTTRLIVKTNARGNEQILVPVEAFVEGSVTIQPRVVAFGFVRPDASVDRSVRLTFPDPSAMDLLDDLSIQATHDCVTGKVVNAERGDDGKVVASLEARFDGPREYNENVIKGVIYGEHDGQQVFVLPYIAVLPKTNERATDIHEQ